MNAMNGWLDEVAVMLREHRAGAGELAGMSDRDLADIGLSRDLASGASPYCPPILPPLPPWSGCDDPARPSPPPRSGALGPVLACALFAMLAIAGVLMIEVTSLSPDSEPLVAAGYDGP
jgi:hypothetical protein